MIEFQEVTKRFGRGRPGRSRAALTGLSFKFNQGETTAIVGPNGAGKSTLLGLTLGFLHPTSGLILTDGQLPRPWVRRHGVMYLPERFTLPAEWRVLGALKALARLEGLKAAEARRRATVNAERFGLATHANRRVSSLSRGLLQRTGLAQATLVTRSLAVFDEPTEGLDAEGRVLFRDVIDELRAAGTTVLIASHDLTELERLAQRALVLESGLLRESIELKSEEPNLWILRLAAPNAALATLFPGAVALDHDAQTGATATAFAVRADGAADLNARLAALIANGALLLEVSRDSASLEERVRDTLLKVRAKDQPRDVAP